MAAPKSLIAIELSLQEGSDKYAAQQMRISLRTFFRYIKIFAEQGKKTLAKYLRVNFSEQASDVDCKCENIILNEFVGNPRITRAQFQKLLLSKHDLEISPETLLKIIHDSTLRIKIKNG